MQDRKYLEPWEYYKLIDDDWKNMYRPRAQPAMDELMKGKWSRDMLEGLRVFLRESLMWKGPVADRVRGDFKLMLGIPKTKQRLVWVIAWEIDMDWYNRETEKAAAMYYIERMARIKDISEDPRAVYGFMEQSKGWWGPRAREVKREIKRIIEDWEMKEFE